MLATAVIELHDKQAAFGLHRLRDISQTGNHFFAITQQGVAVASEIARMHAHRLGNYDAAATAREAAVYRYGLIGCDAVLAGVGRRREAHYAIGRLPGSYAYRLKKVREIWRHIVSLCAVQIGAGFRNCRYRELRYYPRQPAFLMTSSLPGLRCSAPRRGPPAATIVADWNISAIFCVRA